ncbi:oxysterol-binding protein-related protein 4B-like [Juglans microcarpa x Juglans regia]|uniref:oxysterol-binding protein-related protein 4B-like n=1 Tax=Juglans microcarpa x Juglans regia TaxID=2249226 RepID=UPI001B7E9DBC|nr:oxysterol-binding protein-related protein 4B-like [Juglans microcarpa x Juglans regia]
MMQVTGAGNDESRIVLTKPVTLEGESDIDYTAPNPLQLVLSLFKNVMPGSDLSRFQATAPIFNIPKSQLQCFGESVYCIATDMLSRCNGGKSPHDRFIAVTAWSISTLRPVIFGVAPYNPVLGETHHVSSGNLNVLLEQVSHHPPVSALHATDEKENVELIWCHHPSPKFHGTSVEAEVLGKRQLKLLNHGETYVMNSLNLLIRFLPGPGTDWVGKVKIQCQETGLEAELCFRSNSFLWRRGNHRSVKGKIFDSSSLQTLYEIDGHWDRTVGVKDISNGKLTIIYNAKEVISGLNAPIVKDPKEVWPSESAMVWSDVSQSILSKDWEKAREAKKVVEEKQRELLRERDSRGETWIPKHFTVSHSKEGGWDCSPIQKWVPPAPIVVPL